MKARGPKPLLMRTFVFLVGATPPAQHAFPSAGARDGDRTQIRWEAPLSAGPGVGAC